MVHNGVRNAERFWPVRLLIKEFDDLWARFIREAFSDIFTSPRLELEDTGVISINCSCGVDSSRHPLAFEKASTACHAHWRYRQELM